MTTPVSHPDALGTALILGAATRSGKALACRLIALPAALNPLDEPAASSLISPCKPSNLECLS
jgi:hypothetical protein